MDEATESVKLLLTTTPSHTLRIGPPGTSKGCPQKHRKTNNNNSTYYKLQQKQLQALLAKNKNKNKQNDWSVPDFD